MSNKSRSPSVSVDHSKSLLLLHDDTSIIISKQRIKTCRGASFVILSSLFLTVAAALSQKCIISKNMQIGQILFCRKILETILAGSVLSFTKINWWDEEKISWLTAGVLLCPYLTLNLYFSLTMTDSSSCYALLSFACFITVPVGWFVLEENISKSFIFIAAMCVVGAFMLTQPPVIFDPTFGLNNLMELSCCYLNAFLIGTWFVMQRHSQINSYQLIFWGGLLSSIVCAIYLFVLKMEKWEIIDLMTAALLLASGFFGFVGFIFRVKGVNETPANICSILFLSEIIFAHSIRWIFENQMDTNLHTYLGSCALIFGIFLSFYQRIATVDFSDRLQWMETNEDYSTYKALPCEGTIHDQSTSYSVAFQSLAHQLGDHY